MAGLALVGNKIGPVKRDRKRSGFDVVVEKLVGVVRFVAARAF